MKKHLVRVFAAVFALVIYAPVAGAQTGTYAITGAEIVTVSGATISEGTVVIRDGLIEAVGASVKIPADAKMLDGKGLTVYPGFIDANTELGLPAAPPPAQPGAPGTAQRTSNSNYPASLRPEDKAADQIKAGEEQFAAYRNAGFTTVLTIKADGILNGSSAVINLAGDSVSAMILKSKFAQHIAFNTERGGVFPASLMGTFAALRQMFNDAKRLDDIKKEYEKNPKGIKRPEADASLEALIPIVRGETPVVIYADTERELVRALDLINEYKLKAIIAGGQESWKVVSRLKSQNVPVLLSLNLPMRTVSEHKEADPESLRILRLRVEAPKAAAALKDAGVKFAFQSGGLKNIGDFVKNAGVTTENGLAKADAIRAMTLSAAEILGVDAQTGSIEAGKIANLVVVKGGLFDEDSAITHVFVDGKMFELPKKKDPPKGAAGDGRKIAAGGVWNIIVDAPGVSIPITLNLTQNGEIITGNMSSTALGTVPIRNGRVTANGFAFEATVNFQGNELDLLFGGIIDGDKVEGTVDTAQGPATFSGTRTPGAKNLGNTDYEAR